MKKSINFVLATLLLSATAEAKFCIDVNSDKKLFDQKGNLSRATFAFEFDQSGRTQELEIKVSEDKPENTLCTVETPEEKKESRRFSRKKTDLASASQISNVRATLTVTDKDGKSEGIQCETKRTTSQDREYLNGPFDPAQVTVTLSRQDLHKYQMTSGQRRASKETCLFDIVEKSKKK